MLDRWLAVAKSDMEASTSWFASNDASDRHDDIGYQNPRGIGAQDRADARHDDAWLTLYLTQACAQEGFESFVADWRWRPAETSAIHYYEEGVAPPAPLEAAANTALDLTAQAGLSALYGSLGSEECKKAVADPLVAHAVDLQFFLLFARDDASAGVLGLRTAPGVEPDEGGNPSSWIQFEDSTDPDPEYGTLRLNEELPVLLGDDSFVIEDAGCYSPHWPVMSTIG